MIHKTIVVTIGLALVLIAVISAVPVTPQKTYAAGSPGVGSTGGSGSGNAFSGGNVILNFGGDSNSGAGGGSNAGGGRGTQGASGAGVSAEPSLFCTPLNCGGGSGKFNVGGDSVGKGGAP